MSFNKKEYQKKWQEENKERLKADKQRKINERQQETRKRDKEKRANALGDYLPTYLDIYKLAALKKSALKRGLEFNLEEEDLFLPRNCPILDVPFNTEGGHNLFNPSVDRFDSTKGYIKGNVWVISLLANRMKSNATIEQLKKFGEWTQTL